MSTIDTKDKLLIGGEYSTELIEALEKAKVSILVVMYVWAFYPDDPFCDPSRITHLILDGHRRKLDVRVITQFNEVKNKLEKLGLNVKTLGNQKLVHAKFFIIDNKTVFIGSHNISNSALNSNVEVSTKSERPDYVKQLKDYFNVLWQQPM